MILIDYSQVALANLLSFKHELQGDDDSVKNLIRHTVLSTIKSYKKKYGSEFGDLVICCDGRKYWRREVFSPYKASRKKSRDASDLNWQLIFDTLSMIRDDMRDHFPYKVMWNERCEADDIIGVLAHEYSQFGRTEPIMIISSDKDFKQLQEHDNVQQWSPMQKKKVSIRRSELHAFKVEHIVKGDAGDGIPNIFSDDDVFLQEGVRQTPVTKKRLSEFIEFGKDACRDDRERRNWDRNTQLVLFDKIPEDIRSTILSEYELNKPTGDKMSIMNYLIENRCRLLLDDLEDF